MWDLHMGMYGAAWYAMAAAALWLLHRIYELLKAIHFMLKKWFDRDYIIPFEKERGIYEGD